MGGGLSQRPWRFESFPLRWYIPAQSRWVFPLVLWGRATHGTLCGGPPSGGDPRRADAMALLPQGAVTFSVFEFAA